MSGIESEQILAACAYVQARGPKPDVGVVLGSGLGGFADALHDALRIPYASIPNLPLPAVEGHAGQLVLGRLGEPVVACLQGRVHGYEGYGLERVVFGVRMLAQLGCRAVLLTNSAGAVSTALRPGDLMLIVDHLNLTGQNPLVGPAWDDGLRFVDLTEAYDRDLCEAARRAASEVRVELGEGVYAGTLGPSYETPAEVRMLRILGADAVGMSTVAEVIALRERDVRVGAMSCITNLAAGPASRPLQHDEVQHVAGEATERFTRLLGAWVRRAAEML